MISACNQLVERARALSIDGNTAKADRIAHGLAGCEIRSACPYNKSCAATITRLLAEIDQNASPLLIESDSLASVA